MKGNWIRVSRDRRCPICDHLDWCLVSADATAAICARVGDGAVKRCGEAGYLHYLANWRPRRPQPRRIEIAMPRGDVAALAEEFCSVAERGNYLHHLGRSLGLPVEALRQFRVGWSEQEGCSTWPMTDASGRTIGINRRFPDGPKRIMPGHRAGLYVPLELPPTFAAHSILVCEGATDAAAARDLGFTTVGRFSCTHGARLLVEFFRPRRPAWVIIVADADGPGQRGAESLAATLVPYVPALKVITPPAPHKDLRAWCQRGATADEVHKRIEAAEVRRLTVKVRTR